QRGGVHRARRSLQRRYLDQCFRLHICRHACREPGISGEKSQMKIPLNYQHQTNQPPCRRTPLLNHRSGHEAQGGDCASAAQRRSSRHSTMAAHLESREIPDAENALRALGQFLVAAEFSNLDGAEVCTDSRLAQQCSYAIGFPPGTKVWAIRIRGPTQAPLIPPEVADFVVVQAWGNGLEVQGRAGHKVPLSAGSIIRLAEQVIVSVPSETTVDLLCISAGGRDSLIPPSWPRSRVGEENNG
ncbi:hypothetical protein TOPH_08330, partial [Tolypocladium ophioglossoides CBS 100239]